MDERSLVRWCRRGERDAQRELYERHAEEVYRLMLRLSGNREDAFDLTQDTFVRIFERIGSFEGRSGLGTWIYRIATNQALQLLRQRRTQQRQMEELAERTANATDPRAETERREIEDALGRLREPHRLVLLLKYQEGLNYDEIADVLDCPPGTVASRLNRARAELRAVLEGRSSEPAEEPGRPARQNK